MSTLDIPPKSNPAGRLWHLVFEGRKLASQPIPNAVATLFKCHPGDHASVLRGLLNYVDLTNEVERLMHRVPNINAGKHLTWTGKVRQVFQHIGLTANPLQIVLDPFDEPAMSLLSICSDHLESIVREPIVDEAGIQSLLDEALKLHADISKSDIELALREYLLRHLRLVIDALFDYRTKGFESLWNGLAAVKGHCDLSGLRAGLSPESVRSSPLWQRLTIIFVGLCTLVDSAQRVEYAIEKRRGLRNAIGSFIEPKRDLGAIEVPPLLPSAERRE